MTRTTLKREGCPTGVLTEDRVRVRSELGTGDVGDGRSDAPMDVAMEVSTAATPTPTEASAATKFEPME
jgi:hypothetical protein